MRTETSQAKDTRRRRLLVNYHVAVVGGYACSQAAFLLARQLGLCTVDLAVALVFGAIVVGVPALFLAVLALNKNPSRELGVKVSYFQFIWWLIVYAFWVYLLNEMRLMALFFALMPLTLLLTSTNFYQTLYVAVGSALIQIGVTYYAIAIVGQSGNIQREIFIAITFAPAALYLAYLSRTFERQRKDIKRAKRQAEAALEKVWSEMGVAKKIQTILLPKEPKISGYTFSGHMDAADEVGGDYYDVIRCRKRDWLIIGDVSGHGVSAGLVMMMAQTAIHTVLDNVDDRASLSPAELVVRINKTIHDNVRRLGESKYMTITAMLLEEDGRVIHAGLHQDLFVYRSNTADVEVFETDGIWIGLEEHIDGMLTDQNFQLQVGDVLFAYTDGITEARKKGMAKEFYGNDRLLAVLKEHGGRSPAHITEAVVSSLEGYQPDDDVTFIVLRRDS